MINVDSAFPGWVARRLYQNVDVFHRFAANRVDNAARRTKSNKHGIPLTIRYGFRPSLTLVLESGGVSGLLLGGPSPPPDPDPGPGARTRSLRCSGWTLESRRHLEFLTVTVNFNCAPNTTAQRSLSLRPPTL